MTNLSGFEFQVTQVSYFFKIFCSEINSCYWRETISIYRNIASRCAISAESQDEAQFWPKLFPKEKGDMRNLLALLNFGKFFPKILVFLRKV